ncbi:MAG: gamma carbonic anhydrase family protein [Candidatus Helarchaeota archaeon]
MPILELKGKKPKIDETAYISPQATIIGDVEIGPNCSVWPGSIVRGDFAKITINEGTHIQDSVIIHAHKKNNPVSIASYCTIETASALYGCFIADATVIGYGSIIFDGVNIGEAVFVAPNSYIPPGMIIQPRVVVKSEQIGLPAATIRKLGMEEITSQKERAERYSDVFSKLKNWI